MDIVREIASVGLKLREDAGLKLRQPLLKAYVSIEDPFLQDIVKAELNVREIEYIKEHKEGDGLISSGEGSIVVTLDTNMSQELKEEGVWNEFVRKYRDIRKKKGFKIGDMVRLCVNTSDKEILEILEKKFEDNKEELQAKEGIFGKNIENPSGKFVIEEKEVDLLVEV
jgi:hypothetical protein